MLFMKNKVLSAISAVLFVGGQLSFVFHLLSTKDT